MVAGRGGEGGVRRRVNTMVDPRIVVAAFSGDGNFLTIRASACVEGAVVLCKFGGYRRRQHSGTDGYYSGSGRVFRHPVPHHPFSCVDHVPSVVMCNFYGKDV